MGYARWIGAAFGAILGGGVFGAIAGFALGSLAENLFTAGDEGTSQGARRHTTDESGRNGFLMALMILSAHIIQADGKVMHSEMELVRNMLRQNFAEAGRQQGEDILH